MKMKRDWRAWFFVVDMQERNYSGFNFNISRSLSCTSQIFLYLCYYAFSLLINLIKWFLFAGSLLRIVNKCIVFMSNGPFKTDGLKHNQIYIYVSYKIMFRLWNPNHQLILTGFICTAWNKQNKRNVTIFFVCLFSRFWWYFTYNIMKSRLSVIKLILCGTSSLGNNIQANGN